MRRLSRGRCGQWRNAGGEWPSRSYLESPPVSKSRCIYPAFERIDIIGSTCPLWYLCKSISTKTRSSSSHPWSMASNLVLAPSFATTVLRLCSFKLADMIVSSQFQNGDLSEIRDGAPPVVRYIENVITRYDLAYNTSSAQVFLPKATGAEK